MDEMSQAEVFYDYVNLQKKMATYEYVAESNLAYWYECARDDGYDGYLLSLADAYDIEVDYHDWEQDSIHEEIYQMERILCEKMKSILFDKDHNLKGDVI